MLPVRFNGDADQLRVSNALVSAPGLSGTALEYAPSKNESPRFFMGVFTPNDADCSLPPLLTVIAYVLVALNRSDPVAVMVAPLALQAKISEHAASMNRRFDDTMFSLRRLFGR